MANNSIFTHKLFHILITFVALTCEATYGDQFVGVQGTEFVLNGQPFLFNGFNSYWMMHVAAEPAERGKVTEVLREAAANGLTVCRTWAFSDGGDHALQVSPGMYNEFVFQGLDFVISEAQKYGIRLILSLVNNFKDFGGRAQYVQWAQNAGAAVNGEDDFYTNEVVKGYYKNHVKTVLTRINTMTNMAYKDDSTIMAWELMNEPRCQSDYSGKMINGWIQEMSTYAKSLDEKHLLEAGMEGFYGDSMPEKKQLSGQTDDAQTAFVQRWMWSHWDDARRILQKPLVFAEFGKSKKDPGYTVDGRDAYLDTVYRSIYRFARSGGGSMAGGLVWQVMAEGMESYDDGYEIVLSQEPVTTGLIARQSKVMSVLAHMLGGPAEASRQQEMNMAASVGGRRHRRGRGSGGGHRRHRKGNKGGALHGSRMAHP
uniref:mannan endo-1,4-beta-mannosidase n=1 Tax=Ananas comosus var. bracteatus TaxID=296719 RepID=A0A6V7Q1Y1_ANACO|nr:unnamed protein product [Ananas comosus var. bracteatus]